MVTTVVLALAACGGEDAAPESSIEVSSSTRSAQTSCRDRIQLAENFLRSHPDGPLALDRQDEEQLDELVAAIESSCDLERIRSFGSEVLEPWSGQVPPSFEPTVTTEP